MDKEKLKEIKDKTVKVAKDEFNNMKSATSDVKEAIKNKNLDNIKSKDSKCKKKFYLGVGGIIIIILFIIGLFSDDENSSMQTTDNAEKLIEAQVVIPFFRDRYNTSNVMCNESGKDGDKVVYDCYFTVTMDIIGTTKHSYTVKLDRKGNGEYQSK